MCKYSFWKKILWQTQNEVKFLHGLAFWELSGRLIKALKSHTTGPVFDSFSELGQDVLPTFVPLDPGVLNENITMLRQYPFTGPVRRAVLLLVLFMLLSLLPLSLCLS